MDGIRLMRVVAWLVGVVGVALMVTSLVFLHQGYKLVGVRGDSMTPTYGVGESVVVERIDADEVRRGDVVLYAAPDRYPYGSQVIQRVIGVGGDRVVCCAGAGGANERLVRNGTPLAETYLRDGVADGLHRPYDVRVPQGRLFVLGDHRFNARDSRSFADDHGGTVPAEAVVGRVTDDYVAPVLLALALLLGVLLLAGAVVLAVAARNVRRRPSMITQLWPDQF